MAILVKGKTFTGTEQVTSTKLHQLVDSGTFDTGAVDGVTTALSGGAIIVKDGGITGAKLSSTVAIPTGATAVTQAADTNTTAVATCAFAKAEADAAQSASCQRASNLSDVASVSTARTNLGLGTAATAASAQVCKAWVNFNGTGTVAIRDQYNVSSITDNGIGDYTVNFTSAMSNTNYSVFASTRRTNSTATDTCANAIPKGSATYPLNTGSIGICVGLPSTGGTADFDFVTCCIFSN
jgi:hypothetical protein